MLDKKLWEKFIIYNFLYITEVSVAYFWLLHPIKISECCETFAVK